MNGHTTQLGPHEPRRQVSTFDPAKEPLMKFKESREHILILVVLLFFSVNVALAFIHYSSTATIVDSIPAPDYLSAVGEILNI